MEGLMEEFLKFAQKNEIVIPMGFRETPYYFFSEGVRNVCRKRKYGKFIQSI